MADWFRSWHGAPSDPKLSVVAVKSNVPRAVAIAVWWLLLDHASQAVDRGDISGADPEVFAAVLGIDDDTVRSVLSAIEGKGLTKDGRVTSWEKRQPAREDATAAERKRRQRERDIIVTERDNDDVSRSVTHASRTRTEQNRTEQNRTDSSQSPPHDQTANTASVGQDDIDEIRKAVWRLDGQSEDKIGSKLVGMSAEGIRQARNWLESNTKRDILDAIARAYDDAEQRGEPIRRPWSYLDRVMSELGERRAEEPAAVAKSDPWEVRRRLAAKGMWGETWGERPGHPRCEAPADVQEAYCRAKGMADA